MRFEGRIREKAQSILGSTDTVLDLVSHNEYGLHEYTTFSEINID